MRLITPSFPPELKDWDMQFLIIFIIIIIIIIIIIMGSKIVP